MKQMLTHLILITCCAYIISPGQRNGPTMEVVLQFCLPRRYILNEHMTCFRRLWESNYSIFGPKIQRKVNKKLQNFDKI